MGNGEVIPFASSAATISEARRARRRKGQGRSWRTLSGYRGSTGVCLGNRQTRRTPRCRFDHPTCWRRAFGRGRPPPADATSPRHTPRAGWSHDAGPLLHDPARPVGTSPADGSSGPVDGSVRPVNGSVRPSPVGAADGGPGLAARMSSVGDALAGLLADLDPGPWWDPTPSPSTGTSAAWSAWCAGARPCSPPGSPSRGAGRPTATGRRPGCWPPWRGARPGRPGAPWRPDGPWCDLPGTEAALRAGHPVGSQAHRGHPGRRVRPRRRGLPAGRHRPGPPRGGQGAVPERAGQAASADPAATLARIHAQRSFTSWTDDEGAFCFSGRDSAERGARLVARLHPVVERLRRDRREAGTGPGGHRPAGAPVPPPESEAALRADALFALVTGTRRPRPGPDGTTGSGPDGDPEAEAADLGDVEDLVAAGPPATVLVRVDLAALRRGRARPGELCELDGHGTVPVEVVRSLAGRRLPGLRVHRGRGHPGRGPPRAAPSTGTCAPPWPSGTATAWCPGARWPTPWRSTTWCRSSPAGRHAPRQPGPPVPAPPPAQDLRGVGPGAHRTHRRGPPVAVHPAAALRPGARAGARPAGPGGPSRKPGPPRRLRLRPRGTGDGGTGAATARDPGWRFRWPRRLSGGHVRIRSSPPFPCRAPSTGPSPTGSPPGPDRGSYVRVLRPVAV